MKPHLLYLVYRYILNCPVQAQVAVPMAKVGAAGYTTRILLVSALREHLIPHRRARWREVVKDIKEVYDGDLTVMRTLDNGVGAFDRDAMMRRRVQSLYAADQPLVVQARGATSVMKALTLKNVLPGCRVIFDARGLDAAEYLYGRGLSEEDELFGEVASEYARRVSVEQRAVSSADGIICVSDGLREHLVEKYSAPEDRTIVMPCCVDTASFAESLSLRDEVRSELGLSDRLVIVYSGSLLPWQCPEESLQLFRYIREANPKAHFLVLTQDAEQFVRLAEEAGVAQEDRTVRSVPHRDVARYLVAGDIALLLRKRSAVNRVASPVKFGEYLAAGLPVIMTHGIGDYSALVTETGCGCIVEDMDELPRSVEDVLKWISGCLSDGEAMRRRCVRLAAERLDWDVHVARLSALYDGLVAEQ